MMHNTRSYTIAPAMLTGFTVCENGTCLGAFSSIAEASQWIEDQYRDPNEARLEPVNDPNPKFLEPPTGKQDHTGTVRSFVKKVVG